MSIPDFLTRFSNGQTFTTTEVSDNVNQHPTDAERDQFYAGDKLIKIWPTVAFTGIDSGLTVEFRFDTAASLASGSQLVIAKSRIFTQAELGIITNVWFLAIPANRLPSGYDWSGVFYVPENQAATAGAISAALVRGAERANVRVA
ncbi:MAG: hypothetical protein V3W44_04290 [Dehalococcoidales bacterium]